MAAKLTKLTHKIAI